MSVDQIGGFVFFRVSVFLCIFGYVSWISNPLNWKLHKKIANNLKKQGFNEMQISIYLDLPLNIIKSYLENLQKK